MQHFSSKCAPWTSGISTTWELIRSAEPTPHSQTYRIRICNLGGLAVAQWVKNPVAAGQVSSKAWVWSLARHSGLRIQHLHSCAVGCSYSSDSIPGLGTSICSGYDHKKKKNQEISHTVWKSKRNTWPYWIAWQQPGGSETLLALDRIQGSCLS